MYYVYLIRSETKSDQTYIGLTDDLPKRLLSHNAGASKHTSKYKPWKLECYIAFAAKGQAADFERYLKHGSGHAFAKRHFWQS